MCWCRGVRLSESELARIKEFTELCSLLVHALQTRTSISQAGFCNAVDEAGRFDQRWVAHDFWAVKHSCGYRRVLAYAQRPSFERLGEDKAVITTDNNQCFIRRIGGFAYLRSRESAALNSRDSYDMGCVGVMTDVARALQTRRRCILVTNEDEDVVWTKRDASTRILNTTRAAL